MLWLNQQEASLFSSLLSLELREHGFLLLRWSRWSVSSSSPLSCVMSHPVITVPVNRSVFTTAGQTSGWKVHASRWTIGAGLEWWQRSPGVSAWFLPVSLQLITLTFTDPERVFSVGWGLFSFTLKQLCAFLFSDRASGQNLQTLSLNSWTLVGARPLGLLWFCDVYSTSHWFPVTLAVALFWLL